MRLRVEEGWGYAFEEVAWKGVAIMRGAVRKLGPYTITLSAATLALVVSGLVAVQLSAGRRLILTLLSLALVGVFLLMINSILRLLLRRRR